MAGADTPRVGKLLLDCERLMRADARAATVYSVLATAAVLIAFIGSPEPTAPCWFVLALVSGWKLAAASREHVRLGYIAGELRQIAIEAELAPRIARDILRELAWEECPA